MERCYLPKAVKKTGNTEGRSEPLGLRVFIVGCWLRLIFARAKRSNGRIVDILMKMEDQNGRTGGGSLSASFGSGSATLAYFLVNRVPFGAFLTCPTSLSRIEVVTLWRISDAPTRNSRRLIGA